MRYWVCTLGGVALFALYAAPSAATSSADDTISRLERLQRLRDSGALSEAEFQAEKAKILS